MSRAACVLALGLFACAHHDPRPTDALLGTAPLVVGHRGAAAVAPENTLAGFRVAQDLGVPYELDVTLSADGRVVVIHDDSLDRTTDGTGLVDETAWADIGGLDAGGWFSDDFAGEPVPTLDRVFEELGGGVIVDVEIKSPRDGDRAGEVAAAVVDCIARHGMQDRVFVTSFNPYVLEGVKRADPDLPRGQLVGTFRGSDLGLVPKIVLRRLWLNKKADADMIVAEAAYVTPRRARRLQRAGYRLMAWTVNEEAEMRRLLDLGVLGIITDDPARALRVVRPIPEDPQPR